MEKKLTFDKYYYTVTGKYFTELRQEKGRTFEEMALIMDLAPDTYYRYEKGLLKMPIKLFYKLCAFYSLDPTETLKLIHSKALDEMLKDIQ